MKRMNKKGIELSINFIVILIMALVIFFGGLALISRFFGTAQEYKENVDQETEAEIASLLRDGSKVAIPFSTITLKKGEVNIFGLGISNIISTRPETTFEIFVDFSEAFENDKSKTHLTGFVGNEDPNNWLIQNKEIKLKNTEEEVTGIPIHVHKDAKSGTYIYDVYVCDQNDVLGGQCDSQPDKSELYDGYIHKIYITVP